MEHLVTNVMTYILNHLLCFSSSFLFRKPVSFSPSSHHFRLLWDADFIFTQGTRPWLTVVFLVISVAVVAVTTFLREKEETRPGFEPSIVGAEGRWISPLDHGAPLNIEVTILWHKRKLLSNCYYLTHSV